MVRRSLFILGKIVSATSIANAEESNIIHFKEKVVASRVKIPKLIPKVVRSILLSIYGFHDRCKDSTNALVI